MINHSNHEIQYSSHHRLPSCCQSLIRGTRHRTAARQPNNHQQIDIHRKQFIVPYYWIDKYPSSLTHFVVKSLLLRWSNSPVLFRHLHNIRKHHRVVLCHSRHWLMIGLDRHVLPCHFRSRSCRAVRMNTQLTCHIQSLSKKSRRKTLHRILIGIFTPSRITLVIMPPL